jgi:subtilisin-like proprotein convertase family protein
MEVSMATAPFNLINSGFTINDNATASNSRFFFFIPSPFTGQPWTKIANITVTLDGLTHTFPDDLDFLLVGPDGRSLEFWSDAGGNSAISNGDFLISDSGLSLLPDFGLIASGTYRPADYTSPEIESGANWGLPPNIIVNHPAPTGMATLDAVFGGVPLTGNWTLHVRDDASPDVGSLETWVLHGTYNIIVKPNDFDGNHRSDILWQNSDGTPAMWSMGLTSTGESTVLSLGAIGPFGPWPFNPGPSWHVKENGDFDGDGRSDILWQGDDGTPAIWLMNGFTATSIGAAGPFNPGPGWQIKATGDFNFDTKADILWQSSDGTPSIWLMDGLNALSIGAVGPFNPGPTWQIKGTGDFNNDGRSDILWQNSDGTPAIWLMNGMNFISAGAAGPFNPGSDWQIKGTGDFNNDGMSDIVWQHSGGLAAIWLMNGFNVAAMGAVGPFNPGPSWHIQGTGDYNGDARSDILWQADNGTPAIWFMNGLDFLSGGAAGSFNPGSEWHVIA